MTAAGASANGPPPRRGVRRHWRLLLFAVVVVLAAVVRSLPVLLHGVEQLADHAVRLQVRKELLLQDPTPADPEAADLGRRVEAWIAANGAAFAARKAELAARLKGERQMQAFPHRLPYLGGMDGYYWLRQARNRLRTGTACDSVEQGQCRDTYTHAPLGRPMAYPHSAHAAAISAAHRLAVVLDPSWPLAATSFCVSSLVAVAGLLAMFALGCRFGGVVAGFVAAVLLAVNPTVLARTLGADNDDWNVTLPLLAFWALVAAAGATGLRGRLAATVAAAGIVGVHSATWNGWLFFYAILLLGIVGALLLQSVRVLIASGWRQLWRSPGVAAASVSAAAFIVATAMLVTVAQPTTSYWTVPGEVMGGVARRLAWTSPKVEEVSTAPVAVWPSALGSVRELESLTAPYAAGFENGLWLYAAAFLGVLMCAAPAVRFRWGPVLALAAAVVVAVLAVAVEEVQPNIRTTLLLLLVGATLLLRLRSGATVAADFGAVCIGAWFVAGLHFAYEYMRFGLLFAPPLALGAALSFARVMRGLRAPAVQSRLRLSSLSTGALVAFTLVFIAAPVRQGSLLARAYLPRLNDVWWDALRRVGTETAPNAIVHAWWDRGYWVTYVADRRVTADGGSLRTHIPQWTARALLADDERESAGILRMLSCGSDAAPYPEKRQSAYTRLQDAGLDGIAAYRTLIDIARLDRRAAASQLQSLHLPSPAQAQILDSTHCTPAPAYLMLSSALATNSAWMYLGDWSFERAYIADHVRHWPRDQALSHLRSAFGYTDTKAASLYERATKLQSEAQRASFVAPAGGYLTREWMPCTTSPSGSMVTCPLDIGIGKVAATIDAFEYPVNQPRAGALRLRDARSGSVRYQHGSAAAVMVADSVGIRVSPAARPTYPMLAVLLDVVEQRVLVGTPNVLRSVLTQLAFLDGRYSRFFEKFDERRSVTGETVTTWRIRWSGHATAPGGSGTSFAAPE